MRAACIQLGSGGDIYANMEQATHLIRAAHKDGARFIATPENTALMTSHTASLFHAIDAQDICLNVSQFSALAKELSIDLLIGSLAIKLSDTKAANRSLLFGPDGKVAARYDKIHLFDVEINAKESWKESANYTAGTKPVLADIGGFKTGLSICYDLRFAALYKYYARQGAHIMTVPSAFTAVTGEAHWEILLRARAIETSAYIIAPAQGGVRDNGRSTWGRSMIVDPWGDIIAHLDHDKPGYICADLSLETVTDIRKRLPAWQNQTPLP